ncbi:MAG: TraB/GumN family protein [Melioribacteraceae bacterium]|nr:TraB/GumN family protein [Melioribacteraceae bacterium]MCF8356766.1 TraB/GumN family protein [Melioribacteraceae bacterium]MCF8396128.1 TraB/GumN family protein [Melioribacteraceae bacterium]MCF8421106.1 TraB/GumN family protein [Melioribacteraceae bacterium]
MISLKRITQSVLIFFVLLITEITSQPVNSLFWEISGNGLSRPSYLFGTIHIKDSRVFELDENVFDKMNLADVFVMEIIPGPEMLTAVSQAMVLEDGKTLEDVLTTKEYDLLGTVVKKNLGVDLINFNRFKPYAVLVLLLDSKLHKDMPHTLDEYLYNHAVELEKECLGLETVEEQIDVFNSMPNSLVIEFVNNFDSYDKEIQQLIHAYLDADLQKVLELMNEDGDWKEFTEKLIHERNLRMVNRLRKMISEKSVFAAIGAGHLAGKDGLVETLIRDGYRVVPLRHTSLQKSDEKIYVKETDELITRQVQEEKKTLNLSDEPFDITFPGRVTGWMDSINTDAGAFPEVFYSYYPKNVSDENISYILSYIDFSGTEINSNNKKILEGFFKDLVNEKLNELDAELIYQLNTSIFAYPGVEFVADFKSEPTAVISRYFLIEDRLYELSVKSAANNFTNDAVKRFFDSFKPLK